VTQKKYIKKRIQRLFVYRKV